MMMDSNIVSDDHNGFAPVLTYAACEWFLIFLMFIDTLLSYLLVWFARYCRLQTPCFLCSKLLHPLPWRFLLCRSHRTEVSSLMSCHNHDNNLADCRAMCDDCLLSFTKVSGPNPDMNRVLLGKLGYDLLSYAHHPRPCSCCNKQWRTRQHSQRLIRLGSKGRNSSVKPNIPAPRLLTRRVSSGSLKKMRDHKGNAAAYVENNGSRSDGMAHVGYTELKIQSDTDSEFLFSEEDAFLRITEFNAEPKRVHKSRSRRSFDGKKVSNSKQPEHKDKNILVDKTRQKQQPVEVEEHEAVLSELITMSEARPFSIGLRQEDNAGTSKHNENEEEASGNSSPSGEELMNTYRENADIQIQERDVPADFAQASYESAVEIEEETNEAMEQKASDDNTHVPVSDADDSYSDAENGDFKPSKSDDIPVSLAQEESSEKENEVSENNAAEEYFSNEDDEVNRETEQPPPSTSKDVSESVPEEQSSEEEDGSNSNEESEHVRSNNVTDEQTGKEEHEDHVESEPLTSQKESSVENSNKDSSNVANVSPKLKPSASVELFVSISNDVEGENLVDLLKQQLEHERKILKDLNKELEEERNASAVATNQAMAMITRLQEEKAALRMEALQYLRMMDEQAEHDVEALERANDVLADREKEIQDLEMELEYYRVKYPDEPREEILASMGILENKEKSGPLTTEETSDNVVTETKLTGSPPAEN